MKRVQFGNSLIPYFFLLPQIAIIAIFFIWPAGLAVYYSFLLQDPFGISATFAGLANYRTMLASASWVQAAWFTLFFSAMVAFGSLAFGMLLAVKAQKFRRAGKVYAALLMWVYAVAPAVAGAIFAFLINRQIGPVYAFLNEIGIPFEPNTDANSAIAAVIVASIWKQIPVCFIFFLAGLQAIPASIEEAAAIDCQSETRRFWTIVFPLLAPTTFFVLIINLTYAFFDTFAVVDVMTRGQPGGATATLVYKVYQQGFIGADLGGSSAQSVVLMLVVLVLVIVQFRFIEKRVHYG